MAYLIAVGILLAVLAASVVFIILLDKYTTVVLTLTLVTLGSITTSMAVWSLGTYIEANRQECGHYFCMEGEGE